MQEFQQLQSHMINELENQILVLNEKFDGFLKFANDQDFLD